MPIVLMESGSVAVTESGAIVVTESHIFETAEWPPTVPHSFLLDSYAAVRPATLLRTQPEAGPAIVRRRFSAGVMPFRGDIMVTTAQKAELATFYDETLAGGSMEFRFPAPDGTGGSWDCRFMAEPEESPVSTTHWRVSLAMERLP